MKLPCGCCKGHSVLTPLDYENPHGRNLLHYRAGTHSSFLASMIARLSAADYPELAGLTTRDPSDPSIALLDAWATVADVLTFYQERIANEGYLRTATERLSILELARLVGYTLKPGVASSVYLAYMLEKGYAAEITAGQRAQSLPAPGELPQPFETSELLKARSEWNAIRPRMIRPRNITWNGSSLSDDRIFIKGTANNVKAGDCLLLVFGETQNDRVVRLVQKVTVHTAEERTELLFAAAPKKVAKSMAVGKTEPMMTGIFSRLSLVPFVQPAGSRNLVRDIDEAVTSGSDVVPQMITHLNPVPSLSLYKAFANADYGRIRQLEGIYVMRLTASLFGFNARCKPPVAKFTINPSSDIWQGTTLVSFNDQSTGTPASWHWDFGDGESSAQQNTVHTFQRSGSLTVSLTVANDGGTSTAKWTVNVLAPPA